ncbi:MAG: HU-CCDC81 and SPOR domain-containing protein [Flavobacteriaceae bacterium]|nr:HU-CCDC81 and SPOR domain-containing protein [Flavobacteriaceae bacterium]
MALTNYISDLLYRYECVLVPEFGAFLTQKHNAVMDVTTNVFLPPRKVICFNEQLKQNDGLLANHIVGADQCSYTEAVEKITDYVTSIKGKLIAGETVLFEKIGHFSLNNEGKLQFAPLEEVNYLTTAFGLQSTYKVPVLREVYKEEVAVLEEKAPIAFIPETRVKAKRSYLKYAAVAVVALGLSAMLGKGYTSKMEDVTTHNDKVPSEVDRKAYQRASFFDVSPIEVPEVIFNISVEKKQVGSYHIIAGAFRFEENADKKIEQLQKAGFSARKIGQNKYGLHQVVYASIVDKAEALTTLRAIKKSHNSGAWLLVKKLD